MNVTATELKNRPGRYMDAAMREPVIVEKNGRNTVVILAYEDYERLQNLEDAYWGNRALAIEKNAGYVDGMSAIARIAKEKGVEIPELQP